MRQFGCQKFCPASAKKNLSHGNIKTTSSYSEQLVGDNLDARNSVRHQVRHRNANIRHNGVLTTVSILGEKATARFFVNFSDTYRPIVWNIKDQSCLLIFANYASRYNILATSGKNLGLVLCSPYTRSVKLTTPICLIPVGWQIPRPGNSGNW